MSNPEQSDRPQIPPGLTPGEAIRWLNEREGKIPPRPKDMSIPSPTWYEDLVPVPNVRMLEPYMFGVVDPKDGTVHYGWAENSGSHPDNRSVQERAAGGLLDFTYDPTNWDSLFHVYTLLERDGYASTGLRFRAPTELWNLNVKLREFQDNNDIRGAAQYTAKVLFSPWPKH